MNNKYTKPNLDLLMVPKIARLATIAIEEIIIGVMIILGHAILSPAHLTVRASDPIAQLVYRAAHLTVRAILGAIPTVIT